MNLFEIIPRMVFLILLSLVTLGWPSAGQAAVDVFVSIAPQKWLVDRVGGETVSTHILVGKGQDPHTYEPGPRQIAQLSKARLYFTIGLEFEERIVGKLKKAAVGSEMIDISSKIKKIAMTADHHHDGHGHDRDKQGHSHGHQDAGLDPHVWLSPANLLVMADEIAAVLSRVDEQNQKRYQDNLLQVRDQLTQLDNRIAEQLRPFSGAAFFVFHPSFGYFARQYGLNQEAVEVEGKSPQPKQLEKLIAEAKKDGVKVIFTQPQFDQKSAATVAKAIGGAVVPLDPLAEDVAANLETISSRIAAALAH